jgi:septal ring factor EnvC (AmiA/AmiB activator)
MNVSLLLGCLIAIDVLLCAAVIFLLVQGVFQKKKSVLPEETDLQQLQEMLSRSQDDLQGFQTAITKGQEALKELIGQADEREKALRALLEKARQEANQRQTLPGDLRETQRYKDAALLIHQGKTDQEIMRDCHIREGELALIKGLLGIKSESA